MADYSDIVKNINDSPDYLANNELRRIINIGIHDAIRHSNNIGRKSSVLFDLTVHEKIGLNRLIKCETSFQGSVPSEYSYDPINGETNETPHESNTKINYPLVRRTSVETNKQVDIVNVDINIED